MRPQEVFEAWFDDREHLAIACDNHLAAKEWLQKQSNDDAIAAVSKTYYNYRNAYEDFGKTTIHLQQMLQQDLDDRSHDFQRTLKCGNCTQAIYPAFAEVMGWGEFRCICGASMPLCPNCKGKDSSTYDCPDINCEA